MLLLFAIFEKESTWTTKGFKDLKNIKVAILRHENAEEHQINMKKMINFSKENKTKKFKGF